MCKRHLVLLTAATLIGVAQFTPGYAQVQGSTTGAGIDQREANQQQRIQQGINSGALTQGEANRLQHREQSIANQEQRMRAREGGELTTQDRAVLNNRLDRTSNAIHQDKHNSNVSGGSTGAGIDQREANQQRRIQQGINSGSLTKGEANRLEHREQSIANQEQRMRARDGGQLTAHDRTVLNNRLDRTSNAIYRDKHNGRVR
jgi:hypothetical protein